MSGPELDRHLNVFVPYERTPSHEDQLTRAAMLVLRAVPLARDALLARLELPPSARLPDVTVDMQTQHVIEAPPADDEDTPTIRELVSVFLSPDELLDLGADAAEERERGQRLDGVLRFGHEAIVVIESKIVGAAATEQAHQLRLEGAEVEHVRVVHLGWHDLLEDWWALIERGLLGPAERVFIEDLIAFGEEHFPQVLPFTTLLRAGEHPLRRQRRLMAVLRAATGIDDVGGSGGAGANVMLDAGIGTVSTQRLVLEQRNGTLVLSTWPGELKSQATALYRTHRVRGLLQLADHDDWTVSPNLYLGYRGARTETQRLYLSGDLSTDEYVERWTDADFARVGAHPHDEVEDVLWPWLRERGYAGPRDHERLDTFLEGFGRRDAHLRPGVAVQRSWSWTTAEQLDERGTLVPTVRDAVTVLLTALGEPLPPVAPREDVRSPTEPS